MDLTVQMDPPTAATMATERVYDGGWLCPAESDRVRLLDMSPAVRTTRLLISLFCGVGVLAMTPFLGLLPLAVFAVAAGPLIAFDRALKGSQRPERLVAASLSFHSTLIAVAVCLTGGVRSPFLPWIAIPVVTAAARFRPKVLLIASVLATTEMVAAAVIGGPGTLRHDPAPMIGVLVLVGTLVVAQRPVLASEVRWRHEAVLDPLTGLLNRQGLDRRFREVAEQARLTRSSLSMVMCDLDCFKELNDLHGHATGDAVLKETAYLLRKHLRSFELLYRIGGEELLLVLPGAGLSEACAIAELIRGVIEEGRPANLDITASFGVHCACGGEIEFEDMFRAADRALYAAKQAGRNRVAMMPAGGDVPTVLAHRAEAELAA